MATVHVLKSNRNFGKIVYNHLHVAFIIALRSIKINDVACRIFTPLPNYATEYDPPSHLKLEDFCPMASMYDVIFTEEHCTRV